MKFISTKDSSSKVGFKEAVLQGLAPDGGLFVPETIPILPLDLINYLHELSVHELAVQILSPYISEDLTSDQLKKIVHDTFHFDIPLKPITDSQIKVLELFHGPTWSFKDIGVRFLAGCLAAWKEGQRETVILVATSGDTGGAVANGFFEQEGIRVVILYPKDKISSLQEQQLASLGGNVTAVAVLGTFDDCQRLVKHAFNNSSLRSHINITSANSINIARWLPQMIFYAILASALKEEKEDIPICIPSGNYGNIAAAFLLHTMGIRFEKIIAAHNANDTIPRYLQNGIYQPGKTIPTLANAMDVSEPSNFVRLEYLLKHGSDISHHFHAESVSDAEILDSISSAWFNHQYLLDPHTATAWHVLNRQNLKGVIVATAHPYKFEDVIIKALGFFPPDWRKTWKSNKVTRSIIPVKDVALNEILFNS